MLAVIIIIIPKHGEVSSSDEIPSGAAAPSLGACGAENTEPLAGKAEAAAQGWSTNSGNSPRVTSDSNYPPLLPGDFPQFIHTSIKKMSDILPAHEAFFFFNVSELILLHWVEIHIANDSDWLDFITALSSNLLPCLVISFTASVLMQSSWSRERWSIGSSPVPFVPATRTMLKKLVRHLGTANPSCEEYKACFFQGIPHSRVHDIVQFYLLNVLAARQNQQN